MSSRQPNSNATRAVESRQRTSAEANGSHFEPSVSGHWASHQASLSTPTDVPNESSSSILTIDTGAAASASISMGFKPRNAFSVGFPSAFPLHPAKIVARSEEHTSEL